ncbi:MAG: ABC transporter ATP-binding protein [Sphingomicrobium sp.]
MQSAITTTGLRRSFGSKDALRGVDLAVPAGSIFGFLGPNGAGKTTTIRLLLGLLRPSGGRIAILGLPMPARRLEIARSIGALVETPALYDHLTGRENLEITRLLLGLPRSAIAPALDLVDLGFAAHQRLGGYSLGMRQRLALARALLGAPRLLILDEPTNGLDPDGIRDLRGLIRRLAADHGTTVFVSSHQLAEVQQIATHVGLMCDGRLLAQGPLGEVLAGAGPRVDIAVERADAAARALAARGWTVEQAGGRLLVDLAGGNAPDILELLVAQGFRVAELRRSVPTLEELYVRLTAASTGQRRAA